VLGFIPSPHTGVLNLGPLHLHMYGLTLLVAILACIWLTGKRWTAQGGDWDLVTRTAVWGVAFGVIFLGTVAGYFVVKRAGANVALFADAVAPGLLLAQAIGRIGNWWNQELYGKPTTLPWGLKIDPEHRLPQYFDRATYHPTFLYELIWDLIGVGVLLYVGRRFRIRPPGLFALYVAWYCFGRFFEELLRIDPAHHIAGLRLNAWVSIILFVGASIYFVHHQFGWPRRPRRPQKEEKKPAMAIPKSRVR
jgi:prolipoprotein diacylglyceryl transferase